MVKLNRRSVLKLAGGAAATFTAPAVLRAQGAYPSKPINIVVPFDTGGYNDRLARAFAPFLQEAIGQPLIVVNRGGAGALLGHTFFMQQPDDGYTMLCTSAAPYIPLNILTQDANFTLDDFSMVNLPSRDYTMMATSRESSITSVDEVISQLQADAGSLSIGIQAASADLVNMMLFADAHGIDRSGLRLVTFGGGGPTRNNTAGNVVDIGMVGGQGFLPLAEQITPLLVFDSSARDGWGAAIITDVSGPDAEYVSGSQRGWGVHASFIDNHPDRYGVLASAIEETSKKPEVIESLSNQNLATDWYGSEDSNASLRATAEVMEQHVDLLKGT